MKQLNALKIAMDLKFLDWKERAKERIARSLTQKDSGGISQVVMEAGLLIVGITLLVFFVLAIQPVVTDFINTCKTKALDIFNL